jgi:hypothetical protein
MTTQSGWEDIAPNAYEIYSDSWATEDIAPRVKWRVLAGLAAPEGVRCDTQGNRP